MAEKKEPLFTLGFFDERSTSPDAGTKGQKDALKMEKRGLDLLDLHFLDEWVSDLRLVTTPYGVQIPFHTPRISEGYHFRFSPPKNKVGSIPNTETGRRYNVGDRIRPKFDEKELKTDPDYTLLTSEEVIGLMVRHLGTPTEGSFKRTVQATRREATKTPVGTNIMLKDMALEAVKYNAFHRQHNRPVRETLRELPKHPRRRFPSSEEQQTTVEIDKRDLATFILSRDISNNMTVPKANTALLLDFLERNYLEMYYDKVVSRYIAHHRTAEEVRAEDFFSTLPNSPYGEPTLASCGIELAIDIAKKVKEKDGGDIFFVFCFGGINERDDIKRTIEKLTAMTAFSTRSELVEVVNPDQKYPHTKLISQIEIANVSAMHNFVYNIRHGPSHMLELMSKLHPER